MDPDLTLAKAKKLVRQREAVHEQQALLKVDPIVETSIDSRYPSDRSLHSRVRDFVLNTDQLTPSENHHHAAQGKCSRRERGPHSRQQCPAREAQCHNCKKKGHYSSQCFHKSVADVTTAPETDAMDYDVAYLNGVETKDSTAWNCKVLLNDQEVLFKTVTGAEVTVIAEDVWKALG